MTDTTPQVGAVPGNWVYNGITPVRTLSEPGWPDLPARQVVNFTDAEPTVLTSGVIYHVWGGAGLEIGSYWGPVTFETAQEFYAGDAVMLSWTNGMYLAEIDLAGTVFAQTGLRVWRGGCSTQPAEDTAGNAIEGYYLPGGAPQVYLAQSLFGTSNGPTAWNASGDGTSTAGPSGPTLASEVAPATADPCADLAAVVERLVALLRRAADAADAGGVRSDGRRRQAERLDKAAQALRQSAPGSSGPDEERARLVAASLLGTARHVEGTFPSKAHSAEAETLLDELVRLAYACSVEAGPPPPV